MCVTTPRVERKPDARIGLMPTVALAGVATKDVSEVNFPAISSSNAGWRIEIFALFAPKTTDKYLSNLKCEIESFWKRSGKCPVTPVFGDGPSSAS
jgi:hypothetical protein